ncbi:hypothetical protein THAOC_37201, partial [Thalassiosira oceanica]
LSSNSGRRGGQGGPSCSWGLSIAFLLSSICRRWSGGPSSFKATLIGAAALFRGPPLHQRRSTAVADVSAVPDLFGWHVIGLELIVRQSSANKLAQPSRLGFSLGFSLGITLGPPCVKPAQPLLRHRSAKSGVSSAASKAASPHSPFRPVASKRTPSRHSYYCIGVSRFSVGRESIVSSSPSLYNSLCLTASYWHWTADEGLRLMDGHFDPISRDIGLSCPVVAVRCFHPLLTKGAKGIYGNWESTVLQTVTAAGGSATREEELGVKKLEVAVCTWSA